LICEHRIERLRHSGITGPLVNRCFSRSFQNTKWCYSHRQSGETGKIIGDGDRFRSRVAPNALASTSRSPDAGVLPAAARPNEVTGYGIVAAQPVIAAVDYPGESG
jgi:hypothetical protein